MPPKVLTPSPIQPIQPDENDEKIDVESAKIDVVSAKSKSGPIIGIIIAIIVVLAVFYIVRTRCIKKREKGWEIRKSVGRCRCFLRPPRSEEDGIKYRLERSNKKQHNQ